MHIPDLPTTPTSMPWPRRPAEEVQRLLLEEAGVAGIAGGAFGSEGKNFLRFSLVSAPHLLEEALDRIERVARGWRATVPL